MTESEAGAVRRVTWGRWMLAAAVLTAALSGCWDQLAFPNRASTLVMSVRYARRPDRWQWTFYFPNPAVTVSSLPQIAPGEQIYAIGVRAPTLASAYAAAQQRLARDLYLGQLQDIVWSSDAPLPAVASFIAAYNREGMTPKTAYVAVAPPPLDRILAPSPQEVIPSVYLTRVFSCLECQSVMLTEPLWKLWDSIETPGVSPVAPYLPGTGVLSRIAVYPPTGPPVIFSPTETLGWAYLTHRVHKETLTLTMPAGLASITRVHGIVVNHVEWTGQRLEVQVDMRLTGVVAQWPVAVPLTERRLQTLETAGARSVLADCLAALRRSATSRTDPFGYARLYLFRHPGAWGQIPARDWDRLPYTAHVQVSLLLQETGVST